MSDEPEQVEESDEQDEDLELQDEAADRVKGGLHFKYDINDA